MASGFDKWQRDFKKWVHDPWSDPGCTWDPEDAKPVPNEDPTRPTDQIKLPGAGHVLFFQSDDSKLEIWTTTHLNLGRLTAYVRAVFYQDGWFGWTPYQSDGQFTQDFYCSCTTGICTPAPYGLPTLNLRNAFGVSVGITATYEIRGNLLTCSITYLASTGTITQTVTGTIGLSAGIPTGPTSPTTTITPSGTLASATALAGSGSLTATEQISARCLGSCYGYSYAHGGSGHSGEEGIGTGQLKEKAAAATSDRSQH